MLFRYSGSVLFLLCVLIKGLANSKLGELNLIKNRYTTSAYLPLSVMIESQ